MPDLLLAKSQHRLNIIALQKSALEYEFARTEKAVEKLALLDSLAQLRREEESAEADYQALIDASFFSLTASLTD